MIALDVKDTPRVQPFSLLFRQRYSDAVLYFVWQIQRIQGNANSRTGCWCDSTPVGGLY